MKYVYLLLFLLPLLTQAQDAESTPYYKSYDWTKEPRSFEISEEEKKKDEIILFEKKSVEFININDELKKYVLLHRITRLNTDLAIENNNTYYLSSDEDQQINKLKARVIKPNGEMIQVSQSDIKEAKDEDGNVEYKYFAFEGLEIGSYIEYLQYGEEYAELSGSRMFLQSESEKKTIEADIIYPSYLEFQIYPMNGLPTFQLDDSDSLKTRMHLTVKDMPGLEDEDWSAYSANLQKCYFKLSKNLARGKGNFYTYTEVAKQIHENMFAPLTKKEKKLVNAFIEKNTKGATTSLEKVRALENAIKQNIPTVEMNFENDDNIEFILTKKITNEDGICKLMLNCLREMGISNELVITTDRTEETFLEEFQGYNFLQEYLIYVKDVDAYFSASMYSRIGYPPFEFTYNKGIFISEVVVNGFAASVAKVKYIKGSDYTASIDKIETEVKFNDDNNGCKVEFTRTTSGYKALFYQSIIDLLDEEQKKEMKEDYMKYLDDESSTLENMAFENDHTADFGVKPFVGKATVISPVFVERAGNNILLKVGMLIGPQAEMYNEAERILPVDAQYTRGYDRTIVITIPEGFQAKNLEDLKINYTPEKGKGTVGFTSSYEVKGNQVIVSVKEWYNTHFFSVEDYPLYEKTMNSAADFNKIVLVLQEKN
jgi:hypothetical protein